MFAILTRVPEIAVYRDELERFLIYFAGSAWTGWARAGYENKVKDCEKKTQGKYPGSVISRIYEYDQEKADLVLAMAEIRNRANRTLPPPRAAFQDIVQHEPYPVESKAREIIRRLKEQGITRFLLLFRGNRSRSEIVATFLAVLELCRAHVLHLAGSETDCTVRQENELPDNLTW
jgi:chromatin segregation and condensation protein Rec8/ScpA/Scc1 (kleisin family)